MMLLNLAGREKMTEILFIGGFVAIYLFLQLYLLPKMGIST